MITWFNTFWDEWNRRGMKRVKYTAATALTAFKGALLYLGITIGHEKLWWVLFVVLVGVFEWFVDVDENGRLHLTPRGPNGIQPSYRFAASMAIATLVLFAGGLGAYSAFDFLNRTESIRVSVFEGATQIDRRGFAYGLAEELAERTGVSSTVADSGRFLFAVEGRFKREGEKVFAFVHLRDNQNGRVTHFAKREVHSSPFDPVSVSAQNEIVTEVSKKLHLGLPLRRWVLRKRNQASAQWWYEQGMRRLEHWSLPSFARADSLFGNALRKDPSFVAARGGIAYTQVLRAMYSDNADRAFARADSLALDALSTDPDMAEAHLTRGLVLLYRDLRYAAAGVALREAVQRAPTLPATRFWYGSYLTSSGNFKSARAELQTANRSAPGLEPVQSALGQLLYYEGSHAAAESVLVALAYSSACRRDDETVYSGPVTHLFLGRTLAAQGRPQEAEAVYDNLLDRCSGLQKTRSRLNPCNVRHSLWEVFRADAISRQGNVQAADSLVGCVRTELWSSLRPYSLAIYYAGRSSRTPGVPDAFSDSALTWLEKSLHGCTANDPMAASFRIDPALAPLRQTPRFTQLLRKPRRDQIVVTRNTRPIMDSITSTLDPSDAVVDGRYVETFTFAARRGQKASLALTSDDFDTFLRLARIEDSSARPVSVAAPVIACNDDNVIPPGMRIGSLFQYDIDSDGSYIVEVSSAVREQTGNYSLQLASLDAQKRQSPATRR